MPATIVIGATLFAVLRRLDCVPWWSTSIAGFIGGVIGISSLSGFRVLQAEWITQDLAPTVGFGAVTAAAAMIV